MSKSSEVRKSWWANISKEDRSKIMSERKRKGDANRTPEERKAHATIASNAVKNKQPKPHGDVRL